jgi:hypothetical protein
MRFTNTRQFSPVAFGDDLPHDEDYYFKPPHNIHKEFLSSGNYNIDEAWWARQEDRCKNGFTVKNFIEKGGDFLIDGEDVIWYGNDVYIPLYDLLIKDNTFDISGRFYFYLNFWPIYGLAKNKSIKSIIKPRFTAMDFFFFHRLEMMFMQSKDGQELKGRQEGFSEKVGGGVLGWNFSFVPASQNIVVAGEQVDADKTFDNAMRGLDYIKNTQFYKERDITRTVNGGLLHAKYFLSEIRALTARDKPQSLSRFSPYFVIHEEIGKGKKGWSKEVSKFVSPSQFAEGKKTGWQLYIGTGGDMDEGGADLEDRHYDPEEYDILTFQNVFEKEKIKDSVVGHFTGKDWFHFIDDHGNPLREKSRKDIDKKVADAHIKERHIIRSQWAYYASDALMRSSIGYFGQEIIEALQRQKRKILSDRSEQITRVGRLVPKNPLNLWEGIDFVIDEENGFIEILEEPELDENGKPYPGLYKGGTDSYDQDEAETSTSKGSMVIRKTYRQNSPSPIYVTPVALIFERPSVAEGGAELFFMHTIYACIYYGTTNNIEYSNIRIFDFYKNNGFAVLLEQRPQLAFAGKIYDSKLQNQYGTDKVLKPHVLAILKDRLIPEYINNLRIIRIIEALSKFKFNKNYNCDITMAMAEAEVHAKEYEHYVVKSTTEDKTKIKGILVYKRINGELQQQII